MTTQTFQASSHGLGWHRQTKPRLSLHVFATESNHSLHAVWTPFAQPLPSTSTATKKHLQQSAHAHRFRSALPAVNSTLNSASVAQKLGDLELQPIINVQGFINPDVPEGTEATVFAIFNENKKMEYVGFSKDFRNSLRTVFSRRPDKAFFCKACHLQKLDQQVMIDIRTQWFEETGGPPPGNKLAMERTAWQQPVAAGAISDRGKLAAAEATAKDLLVAFKARGCKEEFLPNPALLQDGQVDFLPAKALTPEELERQREALNNMSKSTRTVETVIDGEPARFDLFFKRSYRTNGGYMFDLSVTFEDKETNHRIIVGKEYYEPFGIPAEGVVERVIAFLLQKKIPRQTEGMLLSNQFPINYFSISEVDQFYSDFAPAFAADTRGAQLEGDGKFWRFNRIHDYGAKKEDLQSLNIAVAPSARE